VRIIQVVGSSGTGKTSFIRNLITALEAIGPTGVIKHLGHHPYTLETGKDTTLFFEEGVRVSAGMDPEKSVVVVRDRELHPILALLSDNGIQFAIIEGFKQKSFKKIVFGDLQTAENVLMTEPRVEEVISRLGEFSEFFTAGGIARELKSVCQPGGATLVCSLSCPGTLSPEAIVNAEEDLTKVVRDIGRISQIRLHTGSIKDTNGNTEIYLGICAESSKTAIEAALFATDLLMPLVTGED
jgi:molybdopterin-guanine dinucleotide biosynthesis protein MobB